MLFFPKVVCLALRMQGSCDCSSSLVVVVLVVVVVVVIVIVVAVVVVIVVAVVSVFVLSLSSSCLYLVFLLRSSRLVLVSSSCGVVRVRFASCLSQSFKHVRIVLHIIMSSH